MVMGSGAKSLKTETLLVFGRLMEAAYLPTFQKYDTQKISYNFCFFARK